MFAHCKLFFLIVFSLPSSLFGQLPSVEDAVKELEDTMRFERLIYNGRERPNYVPTKQFLCIKSVLRSDRVGQLAAREVISGIKDYQKKGELSWDVIHGPKFLNFLQEKDAYYKQQLDELYESPQAFETLKRLRFEFHILRPSSPCGFTFLSPWMRRVFAFDKKLLKVLNQSENRLAIEIKSKLKKITNIREEMVTKSFGRMSNSKAKKILEQAGVKSPLEFYKLIRVEHEPLDFFTASHEFSNDIHSLAWSMRNSHHEKLIHFSKENIEKKNDSVNLRRSTILKLHRFVIWSIEFGPKAFQKSKNA